MNFFEKLLDFFFKTESEKPEKRKSTPEAKKTVGSKRKKTTAESQTYDKKRSLITKSEEKYFQTIREIVKDKYIVQPQVNLATVINKLGNHKYQNELYRNIDFGIFTLDYQLIALIEINDSSHNTQKRKDRDHKVKEICEQAHIPLITFWTKYGVNPEYIEKRIFEVIK